MRINEYFDKFPNTSESITINRLKDLKGLVKQRQNQVQLIEATVKNEIYYKTKFEKMEEVLKPFMNITHGKIATAPKLQSSNQP